MISCNHSGLFHVLVWKSVFVFDHDVCLGASLEQRLDLLLQAQMAGCFRCYYSPLIEFLDVTIKVLVFVVDFDRLF